MKDTKLYKHIKERYKGYSELELLIMINIFEDMKKENKEKEKYLNECIECIKCYMEELKEKGLI